MSDKPKDDWVNCFPTHIVLSDEDWEEFMRVMQGPQTPTPSIVEGAKQLRDLYRKRDIA